MMKDIMHSTRAKHTMSVKEIDRGGHRSCVEQTLDEVKAANQQRRYIPPPPSVLENAEQRLGLK